MLLKLIQNDARSTTGLNLRKILLQTDKNKIESLNKDDIFKLQYHLTSPEDRWKENIINELIEARSSQIGIEGFKNEELENMLEFICVR